MELRTDAPAHPSRGSRRLGRSNSAGPCETTMPSRHSCRILRRCPDPPRTDGPKPSPPFRVARAPPCLGCRRHRDYARSTVFRRAARLDRDDGASGSRPRRRRARQPRRWQPLSARSRQRQWQAVGNAAWTNSNSLNDHIVLLYDWSAESAALADGWLDAAADNLFASLLSINNNLTGALQGTSFFDAALVRRRWGRDCSTCTSLATAAGAVLNSLVADGSTATFDELTIDHVTTLDAHPAELDERPRLSSRRTHGQQPRFHLRQRAIRRQLLPEDGSYEPILTSTSTASSPTAPTTFRSHRRC